MTKFADNWKAKHDGAETLGMMQWLLMFVILNESGLSREEVTKIMTTKDEMEKRMAEVGLTLEETADVCWWTAREAENIFGFSGTEKTQCMPQ